MGNPNKDALDKVLGFFLKGDMEGIKTVAAPDIVVTIPGTNQLSGTHKGHDGLINGFIGKLMALTGGQVELSIHETLGGNEHAAGIYNIKATRDGKTLEWRQVNVYHTRDGKISEVFLNIHEFEAWNAFWS